MARTMVRLGTMMMMVVAVGTVPCVGHSLWPGTAFPASLD